MLKYYAHSFNKTDNLMLSDITKLEDILKNGALLSRRKLGLSEEDALFNGMDYISLCDLGEEHDLYSAYNIYTMRGLSLLFDRDIKVIKPIYVKLSRNSLFAQEEMHDYGIKGRYSDLMDEVQVKDELSLEYLRAISLSLKRIEFLHDKEYLKIYLSRIQEALNYYKYHVPIINLDDEQEIDKIYKL